MGPEVRRLLKHSLRDPYHIDYPLEDLCVGVGFLLVLLAEKLVLRWNKRRLERKRQDDVDLPTLVRGRGSRAFISPFDAEKPTADSSPPGTNSLRSQPSYVKSVSVDESRSTKQLNGGASVKLERTFSGVACYMFDSQRIGKSSFIVEAEHQVEDETLERETQSGDLPHGRNNSTRNGSKRKVIVNNNGDVTADSNGVVVDDVIDARDMSLTEICPQSHAVGQDKDCRGEGRRAEGAAGPPKGHARGEGPPEGHARGEGLPEGHGAGHHLEGPPEEHVGHEHHSTRSIILILALSLHRVFEGMSIGLQQNVQNTGSLFLAVMCHETVIGFSLGLQVCMYTP